MGRRLTTSPYPLTLSNLESLGTLTDFLDAKGRDDPHFTIFGTLTHSPLSTETQRHLAYGFHLS